MKGKILKDAQQEVNQKDHIKRRRKKTLVRKNIRRVIQKGRFHHKRYQEEIRR